VGENSPIAAAVVMKTILVNMVSPVPSHTPFGA